MFLLKIVLVVVLALIIEMPTMRTKIVFAFSRGAAERSERLSWSMELRAPALLAGRKNPTKSKSSQERPLEEFQKRRKAKG
jgi:hypothetical protein